MTLPILVIVLAIVVAAVALELGLRWADGVPLRSKTDVEKGAYHPFFKSNTAAVYHRTLGWTNAPNLRWGGLTIDQHGTRLPSAEDRPLPMGAVVACGSSYTAGAEVTDENTWPAQLEAMLGKPVVNAAAGGWAADQIAMRAEEMLEVACPKALIVELMDASIGDCEHLSYGKARKPYFTVENGALRLHNNPVPLFGGAVGESRVLRAIVDHSYLVFTVARRLGLLERSSAAIADYERAMPKGTCLEIAPRLLDRVKAAADRHGTRFVLLVQYGSVELQTGYRWDKSSCVIAWARAAGAEVIDTWDRLRSIVDADPEGYRTLFVVQPDGETLGHMTNAGNRVIAEEVAAVLRRAPARAPAEHAAAGTA